MKPTFLGMGNREKYESLFLKDWFEVLQICVVQEKFAVGRTMFAPEMYTSEADRARYEDETADALHLLDQMVLHLSYILPKDALMIIKLKYNPSDYARFEGFLLRRGLTQPTT